MSDPSPLSDHLASYRHELRKAWGEFHPDNEVRAEAYRGEEAAMTDPVDSMLRAVEDLFGLAVSAAVADPVNELRQNAWHYRSERDHARTAEMLWEDFAGWLVIHHVDAIEIVVNQRDRTLDLVADLRDAIAAVIASADGTTKAKMVEALHAAFKLERAPAPPPA